MSRIRVVGSFSAAWTILEMSISDVIRDGLEVIDAAVVRATGTLTLQKLLGRAQAKTALWSLRRVVHK